MHHVTIYTDGSCYPNPGPGGWAAILIADEGRERELSDFDPLTSNNRMELTAAIQALAALKTPCMVDLITDSQYVRRGMTEWLPKWQARNWRTSTKKPVENRDLWERLVEEAARHTITWHWTRGHNGDAHNERADALACAARVRGIR